MVDLCELAVIGIGEIAGLGEEVPYTVKEASRALNTLLAPGLRNLKRSHEHLIKP